MKEVVSKQRVNRLDVVDLNTQLKNALARIDAEKNPFKKLVMRLSDRTIGALVSKWLGR